LGRYLTGLSGVAVVAADAEGCSTDLRHGGRQALRLASTCLVQPQRHLWNERRTLQRFSGVRVLRPQSTDVQSSVRWLYTNDFVLMLHGWLISERKACC